MKKLTLFGLVLAMVLVMVPTNEASANHTTYHYTVPTSSYSYSGSEAELYNYLLRLIAELQAELRARGTGSYYDHDGRDYVGRPRAGGSSRDDDEPDVETLSARDIEENRAELRGEVDMNDFNNGEVFFVYGEDEDQIEDVEDDFDSYRDVDEDGDDLQKVRVDSDLDGDEEYERRVSGLDEDTDYYYQICVGYEDDDDDDVLECGGVDEFTTDDDNGSSSNDDEPDVETEAARDIEDDSAELHGEVDMNDFNNGIVFFVYGEDEDQVEDIEDDYDTYSEIDEDGDDLQKVRMDSDLDGSASYRLDLRNLDDDTEYFFQICVEYEDDDDDEVIDCGGVEDFETDD